MICKNCGVEVKENDERCSICGADIKRSSLLMRRKIILALIVIDILFIVGALVFIFLLQKH